MRFVKKDDDKIQSCNKKNHTECKYMQIREGVVVQSWIEYKLSAHGANVFKRFFKTMVMHGV